MTVSVAQVGPEPWSPSLMEVFPSVFERIDRSYLTYVVGINLRNMPLLRIIE